MKRITRRQALRATAGAATLSLLAGCADEGGEDTPTDTATPTPTGTASPTDTATDTPSIDPEALKERTTAYVEGLAAGEYERLMDDHDYTDQVLAQFDAKRLEQLWTSQTGSLGQFVEVASVEYGTSQGYHVVVARARFTGGLQLVQLSFDGQERIAGLAFPASSGSYSPPDYADTDAFSETELPLTATEGCELPARLTVPTPEAAGDGPVPGVVLVHGSGPQDMDQSIGHNRVFQDLAWGLASRGVAVCRYDKRTYACDVDRAAITLDGKVTDDALTALSRLREANRVDSARTAVVGHSLGGMVAPRIASEDGQVAGAAMLAANARPLPDLVVEQSEYLANLDGSVSDAEQEQFDAIRETVERIRAGDVGDDEVVLDLGGDEWWADLADYDQVATAEGLDVPLTFHQGVRDYQVSVDRDFGRWQEALGDREDVTFERYDALNHLFVAGEGDPNPSEYFQPGNVDRAVVENLASWARDAL